MTDGKMPARRVAEGLDRRQVLRALLLGAAGLAVPAACGLPTGGAPVVDGPALTGPGNSDTVRKAPVPQDAPDPLSLVNDFFGTVAGRLHLDADLAKADERAQAFLTKRAQDAWPQGSQITVVRIDQRIQTAGDTPNSTFVDVTLKPTGVLQLNGIVAQPTVSPEPRVLRFTVVPTVVPNSGPGQGSGYLIDEIKPLQGSLLSGMMLDAQRLDGDLYVPQLIYFWSTDSQRRGLVPDLRYLPQAGLGPEIQYTEIVDWVLAGPSDLIANAVQGNQYSGNSLLGPNLTAPDRDGLLINLANPPPQGMSLQQVMWQMRWSLHPVYLGTVRLQVNSQPQQVDGSSDDYRRHNLADIGFRADDDSAFCVAGGAVRRVADPESTLAIPDAEANKDVVLAALSRDLKAAALVKTDHQLYVGEMGSDNPQFATAKVSGQPLTGTTWTRPAFLPANGHRVLVGLDGRLYLVKPDGAATALGGTDALSQDHKIEAFSVAPDGHRIGLIAGGGAFVCGLKVNGDDISLGQPRPIDTGLDRCTAIAWSRLDRVLVAGQAADNAYQLAEVTIDGAITIRWAPRFSAEITSVVARPQLPWFPTSPGAAILQTTGGARLAGQNHNDPLVLPAPSQPSPSASGAPAAPLTPSNPFYLD